MSSNAAAWTQAEQYKADHPQLFATSRLVIAIWIGLAVSSVLGVVFLWDAAL